MALVSVKNEEGFTPIDVAKRKFNEVLKENELVASSATESWCWATRLANCQTVLRFLQGETEGETEVEE